MLKLNMIMLEKSQVTILKITKKLISHLCMFLKHLASSRFDQSRLVAHGLVQESSS